MGGLVNLAKEILRQAEILERQLEDASAPAPTFDEGSPLSYPKWSEHPEIFRTRSALVDASKSMYQLALGPADAIRSIIGPEKIEAFTLNVIDHYKIVDIVPKEGSISFEELAAKLSVQQELLERIMRFAFSMNLFKEEPAGSVSHTSLSEASTLLRGWDWLLNRKDTSTSFSSWPEALSAYSEPRKDGIRQLPFNIGNDSDTPFFDVLNAETNGMKNFGEAMRSHSSVSSAIDTSYLTNAFDWAALGKGPVVDLGGGNGHISIMLAEKFPNLHFIIQDLQTSEAPANALIPAHLKDRISFQPQDFFKPQGQETGAKVFMLRAIMHDWPDEECAQILRNLIPDVQKGAKILLVDRVLPLPGRKPTHMESFVLFMDLLMFTYLGAKERNPEQWKAIVEKTDPRLKMISLKQLEGCELGVVEAGF